MPGKRVYRDEEIHSVLKRAAELHQSESEAGLPGLSLEELQEAAADVGIGPEAVKAAARELGRRRGDDRTHFIGAPVEVEYETFIEEDVAVLDWDAAVAELRRIYRGDGKAVFSGVAREWVFRDLSGERARVALIPYDGGSRLRITHHYADYAWAWYGGIISTVIPLIFLNFFFLPVGIVFNFVIALITLLTVHLIARTAFSTYARGQERQTRDALSKVEDIIAPVPIEEHEPTGTKRSDSPSGTGGSITRTENTLPRHGPSKTNPSNLDASLQNAEQKAPEDNSPIRKTRTS